MLIKYILIIFVILLLTTKKVFAYIGPGVGIGALALTIIIFIILLFCVIAFIYYPIKKIIRKIKSNKKID